VTPPLPPPQGREEQETAPAGAESLSTEILDSVTSAFGAYGRKVLSRNETRKKIMRARVREHGGDASVLAEAVHGYVYHHRRAGEGFDPMAHFTPETVFRASNFAKYLESAQEARESGRAPPYVFEAPKNQREGFSERVDRIARGEF
jgi:hypothetical protein